MLLVTPILLNYLEIEGYATWVLINSIIASLSIFNFGGSDTIIKFISSHMDVGDHDAAGKIFSTVFIFQSLVVAVIYTLFLIIMPFAVQYITSNNFFDID
jgi:O-antigen/teichoic acid export membrane protein